MGGPIHLRAFAPRHLRSKDGWPHLFLFPQPGAALRLSQATVIQAYG